jgi:Tfp pilus assembly protein PilF
MWNESSILRWSLLTSLFLTLASSPITLNAQVQPRQAQILATNLVILVIENDVQVLRGGTQVWETARTNQILVPGDRIRVGPRSRAAARLSNQTTVRLDARSDVQINPPNAPAPAFAPRQTNSPPRFRFNLISGFLHFLHRDTPTDLEIDSRTASAAVRGTDFAIQALDDGTTIVTVIDGDVELSNALGSRNVTNHQQGIVEPGKAPVLRPAIEAVNNIIQWTLYYPGILDPDELLLNDQERALLAGSLIAYRSGDLLDAIAKYPDGRTPQSDGQKIYLAALLLSVGQVNDAQALLSTTAADTGTAADAVGQRTARLANALRQLVATVKLLPAESLQGPQLATELLAESYYRQSGAKLEEALKLAREAAAKSPQFGFAWARVSELEFSFGRINNSSEALAKALQLSPRNAQAIALNGFLYAAKNKIRGARQEFQRAIETDGALANAWLGRGLCRIRQGDAEGGREDLLIAAALEPQRAVLRSYLGKAYAEAYDRKRAEHELELAKDFDPHDPTAWLYSALLKQQHSQINDAIRDLVHAQDLSTNRVVYRSEFLLDQDRAVRSANLAHIYRDAGMSDWSVREAGSALSTDYANYSAHLFLANSYDELRDPNRINLRYETPAESEYLIANLLAPVGAGTLSQSISQGEYSKLFEHNRLGVVSSTEYLSRGAWYENGAQFGIFGNTSYALEAVYRNDPGQRPNNDFYERELRLHLKQQLTPQDTIYLRAVNYESAGGDRFQYYENTSFNAGLRTRESQDPALVLGYHHEWNPDSHLLLVGARFDDTYAVTEPAASVFLKEHYLGDLIGVGVYYPDLATHTKLELYSAELQQIWETARNTAIIGARYQTGDFDTGVVSWESAGMGGDLPRPPNVSPHFDRSSIYAYDSFHILDSFTLVGGLSYEHIRFPQNFRSVPGSEEEDVVERLLPKGGFVWKLSNSSTVRAAYTRSLAGASLDQSIRIEPTEVAGFNQAFRGVAPESVVGANAGARLETYDLSFEQRAGPATYFGAGGELLYSHIPRVDGAFSQSLDSFPPSTPIPSGLNEVLDYRERSLLLTVDQLLGKEWALGGRYRLTEARLDQHFPEVSYVIMPSDIFRGDQHHELTLHQLDLHVLFNHETGFFTQFNALWNSQNNSGPDLPGDQFWQFNFFAGYRFAERRAQLTLGFLNLTDRDYHLDPLVLHSELPRGRTFMTRLDLSF